MSPQCMSLVVKASMSPQCTSFCKPLFRTHVSSNYHFTLPKMFCDEHMPCQDSAVVLVDESGREYSVLFSHLAKENKRKFTRGWKDFVIAHSLLEGDALSFHLIEPCKFKVRIIRASRPIQSEYQDDKSLVSVNRLALLDRMDVEMDPKLEVKQVYIRRKLSSRQTYDGNGTSNLRICDGERTRIVRKELCVTDQSSQWGIENSEAALKFQDINSFEEFKIYVNGETLDLELPTHIRMKYYKLCCVQNQFLHEHLIGGVDIKSVAEMIHEITSIADAMVSTSISTPVHDLDRMDRTLQSFEDLGMSAEYLRAEIRKLIKLSREHQTVEESSRAKLEEIEREKIAFMDNKSRIDELIESTVAHGKFIGHLEANVDDLKEKMADISLMFKEVTDRMKCSGTRPSRNKRAPFWAADYV